MEEDKGPMGELDDAGHFCEVCGERIEEAQAYLRNGLCEECWNEERILEEEYNDRT